MGFSDRIQAEPCRTLVMHTPGSQQPETTGTEALSDVSAVQVGTAPAPRTVTNRSELE